jgi:UDP-N-acetylmuramate--alanine ligase
MQRRELGVPVLHRSEALAALAATRRTIAVAGSHGKTTTSSMLALICAARAGSPAS